MNQISRGCSRDFVIDMPYEAADVVAVDIGLRQRSALIMKTEADCAISDKAVVFGLSADDTLKLLPEFASIQAVLLLANGKVQESEMLTLRIDDTTLSEEGSNNV